MDKKLIQYLEEMNEQEADLRGSRPVLSYYTKGEGSTVVDAGITMRPMTLIDLLKQPRFVPLPRHTHNYMELVYMCSGSTTHVINEETQITLQEGELLFLQQGTSHSVSAAGYHDIAVRFMIRPAFLQYPLSMLREDTVLRRFIQRAAKMPREGDFLQFHIGDMPEAKNLLENMTRMLLNRRRNSRQILQATMGVLLLELSGRTYKITVGAPSSYEQEVVLEVMNYIETEYETASLADSAKSRSSRITISAV